MEYILVDTDVSTAPASPLIPLIPYPPVIIYYICVYILYIIFLSSSSVCELLLTFQDGKLLDALYLCAAHTLYMAGLCPNYATAFGIT